SGQTLSQFGDAVLWLVLPLSVYATTKSPLDMGWIMGLLMVPQVILLPFAGVIVDRISRSQAMIVTESIRFLLVAGLAVMSALRHLDISILAVFAVAYGTMDALFQPAYAAARAQIFTTDIRNAAVSLSQMSQEFARLVGPALGGIIAGFVSVAAGFALDAVMLLFSVASLTFLRLEKPAWVPKSSSLIHDFTKDLLGGFLELRKHSWLWITILAFTFINIASTGLTAILLPWLIKIHLNLSDISYGLVNTAAGIGAISAAFVYGRRNQYRHRGYLAYGVIAANALALLLLAFVNTTIAIMVLMALANGAMMLFMLIWESSLQELIPAEAYGRVASLDLFGSWTLLPLGNVVTGWLATRIGGVHTMVIEATVMLCVAVFVGVVPAIRKFD
ncbi:MAG: hypothetical protein A2201_00750, partial [Alicyclobacillus sp. RIFOXYA1_FULL_53_8]